MSQNAKARKELIELGEEYRQDWSGFDGRLFQMEVECIANQIVDNEKACDALRKLGEEYREDWYGVDGRMIQCELEDIAEMIQDEYEDSLSYDSDDYRFY